MHLTIILIKHMNIELSMIAAIDYHSQLVRFEGP